MNPLVNVWERLGLHALQMMVFATTATMVLTLGLVANGNPAVHEVLHDLRHAIGLPCH